MKKFHFKKSVSQEETPTLLRLERRHTLMNVSEEVSPPDSQRMSLRSPTPECMELNKLNKLSQSSTDGYGMKRRIPAKSLSCDAKNSECSPSSSVIITDSDLSSSWIYKSKKEAAAACNDVFENSPCDPKSPLLQPSTEFEKCKPRTPRTPKSRIAEKGSVIIAPAKRPQTCSSCCCIFAILLLVCLCSIGIMSAIGGIVYLELYSSGRPRQVSLASHLEDANHGDSNIPTNSFIKEPYAMGTFPQDGGNAKSSILSATESDALHQVEDGQLNIEEMTDGSESHLDKNVPLKNRRGRILDDVVENSKVLFKENDIDKQDDRNNLEFIVERQLSHLNISLEDLTIDNKQSSEDKVSYVKEEEISIKEGSIKISENESLGNKSIDSNFTKQHQLQEYLNKNQDFLESESDMSLSISKPSPDTSKIASVFNSVEQNSSPSAINTNSDSNFLDSKASHQDINTISLSAANAVSYPDSNEISHPDTNSISNSNLDVIMPYNAASELASNSDLSIAPNTDSNAIASNVDTNIVISNADIKEQDVNPDYNSFPLNPDSNALAHDLRLKATNLNLDVLSASSKAMEAHSDSGKINENLDSAVMSPNTDSTDMSLNLDVSDITSDSSETTSNPESSNLEQDKEISQPLPKPDSDKLKADEETIEKFTNSPDVSEPIVITSVAPTIPFEFFRRLEMEELPEAIAKSRGIIDMQSSLADAIQKMQHLNPSNKYPSSRNKMKSPQRQTVKPQIVFSGKEANIERLNYKQKLRTIYFDRV